MKPHTGKETLLLKYNENHKQESIARAAALIKAGELVAFPTETVYGLGADVCNEEALAEIFRVKNRPPDNPLIVHISDLSQCENLAENFPPRAALLAEHFWPGPLTLILKRSKALSPLVSASLETVAVRMPSHPAALELIEAAQTSIAAPSANISGTVSPTDGAHVMEDLQGKIAAVLDGGRCTVGLESTVLDITGEKPVLLRPGSIGAKELTDILKEKVQYAAHDLPPDIPSASPGMKYRHYSPRAHLLLFRGEGTQLKDAMTEMCRNLQEKGKKVGVLCTVEKEGLFPGAVVECLGAAGAAEEAAFSLYSALRNLDNRGAVIILAQSFSEDGIGGALMNRLEKAAKEIIHIN